MKIAYVAGPFRAATPWEVEQNVRMAEEVGLAVAEMGYMPLIPHSNTRFFNGLLTDEFWLEGTLELLRRCDVLVWARGRDNSAGVKAEITEAHRLGIPVCRLDYLPMPGNLPGRSSK